MSAEDLEIRGMFWGAWLSGGSAPVGRGIGAGVGKPLLRGEGVRP